jgi:hypothetical protein
MNSRLKLGLLAGVAAAGVALLVSHWAGRPPATPTSALTPPSARILMGNAESSFSEMAQAFWRAAPTVWRKSWELGGPAVFSREHLGGSDLLFYLGHGTDTSFDSLEGTIELAHFYAGGASARDSSLRYFWQCSCNTFAHGPKCPTLLSGVPLPPDDFVVQDDYGCPDSFGTSPPRAKDRNAFADWGPRLGDEVRMACGSSSLARCWRLDAEEIWDNYNTKRFDVADSFIAGLHPWYFLRPVCLARGGKDPVSSALYDSRFIWKRNRLPHNRLYLEYIHEFKASAEPPSQVRLRDLFWHALDELRSVPPASLFHHADRSREIHVLSANRTLWSAEPGGPGASSETDTCIKYPATDDRVLQCHLRALDAPLPIDLTRPPGPADEQRYIAAATKFVQDWRWCYLPDETPPLGSDAPRCGPPRAFGLRIDAVPFIRPGGAVPANPVARYQKCVVVVFARNAARTAELPVLNGEGTITIQLDNHARVVNAVRHWLRNPSPSPPEDLRKYEEAWNLAVAELPSDAYARTAHFDTGGLSRLDRGGPLVPVLWFYFIPRPVDRATLIPLTVEVPLARGTRARILERGP